MDLELYQYLNNYSLHSILTTPETAQSDINQKKSERLASKDVDWPEIHTVTMAGFIHNPQRFGFDGFDDVRKMYCEVKSSSKIINKELLRKFSAGLLNQRNEFIDSPFDGRGVFSLFTHEAYVRYMTEDVNMLISAYINGVLMFIIEFPFRHSTFEGHVKRMLERSLPNGDKPGRAKTISFGYNQYKDCNDAKLIFLTHEANLKILKGSCSKHFYAYLTSLQK
jgi:hypothetical protein